jgi:hypothetical protein
VEIVEQTPARIKLQTDQMQLVISKIWAGLGGIMLGLALMIFGMGPGEGSGTLTTLTCERQNMSQGTCQLVSSRLIVSTKQEIPLSQLKAVSASIERGQILLLTTAGEIPFAELQARYKVSTSDQKLIDKINRFIRNPQVASLQVKQDNRWIAYLFGGVAILSGSTLLGIALLVTESMIICVFDKTLGQMVLQKQRLFSRETVQRQLQDIQTIRLQEQRDEIHNRIQSYRIFVVLKGGDLIPLGGASLPSYQDRETAIAKHIYDWLQNSD